jgi:ribosomal protein S18 acetylase RimI-like enzyme
MDRKTASTSYRLNRMKELSLHSWGDDPPSLQTRDLEKNVCLDCGWGNLIFGQTFSSHDKIIDSLSKEKKGKRDIAIYIHNHHVLLGKAPEFLFLDPSDTFRLWLYNYRMPKRRNRSISVRLLQGKKDIAEVNRIYDKCGMIKSPEEVILRNQKTRVFTYYLAESVKENKVIGSIMGIDHKEAFNDPDNGASFWCLAVDPEARERGVGRALVRALAECYLAKGRSYLDLSVLHDNKKAVSLYRDLGFSRIPVFVIKKKNEINSTFYLGGPQP